jgi:hypothetical protein
VSPPGEDEREAAASAEDRKDAEVMTVAGWWALGWTFVASGILTVSRRGLAMLTV